MKQRRLRRRWSPWLAFWLLAVGVSLHSGCLSVGAWAQNVRPPESATTAAPPPIEGQEHLPTHAQGRTSDADIWRAIKKGEAFSTSLPGASGARMIQIDGDRWLAFKNGPLLDYSVKALVGTLALLAVFFVLRGRVRIEGGPSAWTIIRFDGFERFIHWLTGTSFIVLALTGLNLMFGRYQLRGWIGDETFASLTSYGKLVHNYVGFAFTVGLALMLLRWVLHNFPAPRDLVWLAKGGGLFWKNHPPAKKFNFGQKLIFWAVILGGASLALSGLGLMMPFEFSFFADTFFYLNAWFGTELPTELSALQEMQLTSLWHSIVSIALICIILAHIYIGSVGMEGAFSAMGSGEVDLNWAREHHDLWVRELELKGRMHPVGDD